MFSYSWIFPKAIMFVGDVQLFVRKMPINYVMSKEKKKLHKLLLGTLISTPSLIWSKKLHRINEVETSKNRWNILDLLLMLLDGCRFTLWFSFVRAQYVRMPNTYDSYVLGWNSHFWPKNELLSPIHEWLWLSKSYKYRSSSLGKFISSLRTTRPTAISSKDNSTNGNFVQIQSSLSLQGLVEAPP